VCAAVLAEVVEVGRGHEVGAKLHHGGHLGAPGLARSTDHDGVEHGRMALQGLLDLLGEDLLATGIDRHRAPTVNGDRPVGQDLGHIARDRVAHPVDDRENDLGLRLVLVTAERDVAAGGEHPHPTVT
jgi:hypothetical protein